MAGPNGSGKGNLPRRTCISSLARARPASPRCRANLLPGRSFLHHLYSLLLVERPPVGTGKMRAETPLPMPARGAVDERWFPATDLIERLTFGELPAVAIATHAHRGDLLRA